LVPSKEREGTAVTGIFMRAINRKSRMVKQHTQGTLRLSFNKGLDKYFGLLEIGIDSGIIKKEGRSVVFPNGMKVHPNHISECPEKYFTKETLDALDEEIQKRFCYNKEDMAIVHGEEEDEDGVIDINPADVLASLPDTSTEEDPYSYDEEGSDPEQEESVEELPEEEEQSEEDMSEPVDLDAPDPEIFEE